MNLPSTEPRKTSVLVLEDHIDSLNATLRLLNRMGYEAVGARSLAEGRQVCAGGARFDVAVADIGLPDGDGRDLLHELMRDRGTRGIIVSGFHTADVVSETTAMGLAHYLLKPMTIHELDAAIRQALGSPPPR